MFVPLRTCRLVRNILADKPRVTKFPIEFDAPTDSIPVAGDASAPQGAAPTPGGFGSPDQQQQQQQAAAPFDGGGDGGFRQQQAPGGGGGDGFGGVQLGGQFDAVAQVQRAVASCMPSTCQVLVIACPLHLCIRFASEKYFRTLC